LIDNKIKNKGMPLRWRSRMTKETVLLECWRELTPEAQDRVLEFVQALNPHKESMEFIPQTPLGNKLWEIRQRAISKGLQLLSEKELEEELADRRGGYREA
jgi:hypothetical protein